jgi:hypothetical protein
MSTPEQGRAPIADGTDISVSPEDLETEETPATSDAEAMGQDDALGGTGGADAGGAG